MNTRLDPPPVRPLTPAQRARLRNRIMDQTRPAVRRPTHRWIAPVVGVSAVAAVVAGTLVVTNRPAADQGVAPAGSSSPSPSTPAVSSKAVAGTGVDLGAIPQADLSKLIAGCKLPQDKVPVQLVWSRHVRGPVEANTTLLGVAKIPVGTGSKVAYRVCTSLVPPKGDLHDLGFKGAISEVEASAWATHPTKQRSLVVLGGFSGAAIGKAGGVAQVWDLYRALPDVARVEARLVINGKPGAWINGVVDDGFAYVEAHTHDKVTASGTRKLEVRAFDAAGHQLPVG